MELIELAYGSLSGLPPWTAVAAAAVATSALGYFGAPALLWAVAALAFAFAAGAPFWVFVLIAVPGALFGVPAVRQAALSGRMMLLLRRSGFVPKISETERAAIEAGNVWVDGELFSGHPDLARLNASPYPDLTDDERAFLEGPVERVCRMTDDWSVFESKDLPNEVWAFLREQRFFGLVIPKQYGGLGMSASAHSAVVAKLTSRSMPLAITVMVPNSLGPAELLVHYGTDAQKKRWLPALASGAEIPCFALTEPTAGSDAGGIRATGVVFRGEDGRLMLRLSWNKRYITLAAVATVLGLAFQLHDPDNLLGKGPFPGITCALVPASTPGVKLGRRHDPMGVPFFNCPTQGEDVVVPLEESVIGGKDGAGQGWRMLMECLAAGRGISLPANSTGGAWLVARTVGAYASIRKQFGLPVGRFEGVQEPLARIAGTTYLLEALRRFTCGGLDSGQRPPVVTAIAKLQSTELWRKVVNDGMDVLGGAGISRGPRNLLAHPYAATPICITVEGANILTRTLMIFGQGAIRCHPFAFAEIRALENGDVRAFDREFFGHVRHLVRNAFRSAVLSLTRGFLVIPPCKGPAARYWQRLSWASSLLALWSDLAMGALGGDLKRKESITGRFADVFSWLYLGAAVLRRFEAEGRRPEDVPLMRWSMELAFQRMQEGFDGLFRNLRLPGSTWLVRGPIAAVARWNRLGGGPDDRTSQRAARILLEPGQARDRLTAHVHVPRDESQALGRLENAMRLCNDAEPLIRKLRDAVRSGRLPKARPEQLFDQAREAGILTDQEHALATAAERARADAIAVDSFSLEDYARRGPERPSDTLTFHG
ncbi:MAG: acyl-CoA dehydrogenase [Planctomycetota bacterium]